MSPSGPRFMPLHASSRFSSHQFIPFCFLFPRPPSPSSSLSACPRPDPPVSPSFPPAPLPLRSPAPAFPTPFGSCSVPPCCRSSFLRFPVFPALSRFRCLLFPLLCLSGSCCRVLLPYPPVVRRSLLPPSDDLLYPVLVTCFPAPAMVWLVPLLLCSGRGVGHSSPAVVFLGRWSRLLVCLLCWTSGVCSFALAVGCSCSHPVRRLGRWTRPKIVFLLLLWFAVLAVFT